MIMKIFNFTFYKTDQPLKSYPLLRILLNTLFIGFIFSSAVSNNVKNIPISYILLYNFLLLFPAWIHNFWLVPRLQYNKNVLWYFVATISLISATTFVLGEYLHYLYQKFSTEKLIDFTPIAATSSAPQGLEKYQYYFDAIPGIIIVMGIMIIGYAIQSLLLKIKKERQIQTQQNIAELSLLKSQISPHFLFNVLNSLYSLSLKKSEETPNVILKLSDILRYSLYEAQEKEILVTEEIHILNTYIDIERLRLSESASLIFNHDSIKESVKIAPMLLLPLIENAFKHGTDSTIGHSHINASLNCNDNNLIFTCENSYKESVKKEVGGIGLENIRKRLQLIYPSRHQFQIEQSNTVFKVSLEIKL